MRGVKKIVLITVALVMVVVSIGGCHTIRGMGRDIERGGEKLQDVTQ